MVVRCKPLTKDHLPLKTTFPGTKGWSLVTGFTVLVSINSISLRSSSLPYCFFNAVLISFCIGMAGPLLSYHSSALLSRCCYWHSAETGIL